jgi:hypothetical protein
MSGICWRGFVASLGMLVIVALLSAAARAQDVVVGVNVVNPMRASLADQNAVLEQLKVAHVHVIRCGISADDKGIDFARRAAAQGIKIQLILGPQYPPNAPSRAYQPDQFPAMWGGHPLSWADVELSRAYFQKLLDALDTNGIVLAGMELGNEINWAAFNPEFPLPGEGKIFNLSDLSHDPEAMKIANGFLQYLKVLAVLKDVRDHSRLNRTTPIISAGLVDAVDGQKLYNTRKEDMVSLSASLAFLRAHGLDQWVDAYGIHTYPSGAQPGNPTAAAARAARFTGDDMAACRPAGSNGGKPCWITEWGFPNADLTCPLNDANRALLVKEMRVDFARAGAEKRLVGITYFAWNSDPWSKQPDADSVYRCGALTESGRLAVAPLDAVKAAAPDPAPGTQGIRIRVGVPLVARGPAPNIADNTFTEIRLPNGKFRGFTAAGTTFAIDGNTPWDMGGQAVTVLKPGPANSASSCGQWLNHVEQAGNELIGWIHNETACDYKKAQTHAALTIGTSTDDGLTWSVKGFIITGKSTDKPVPGRMTGESCASALNGKDGYYYAYCGRNVDHVGYVARAPVADPGPGKWEKYFDGAFSQPGVGGDASQLGGGGAASTWLTTGETVRVVWVKDGLGLAFSQDRLHFTAFPLPMMKLDTGRWDRKGPPNELLSYATLIDDKTGANLLGDHWLLAYMYLQPNEGFNKRYLVFRPVDVSRPANADEPAAAIMLTHWYDARLHDHWATVAPVPGNYSAYKLVAQLGYMLTEPDPAHPSVELEDCVSQWPGHPDHILIQKGVCESHGYMRLRSAGFVYANALPNTQPLFRCYSGADKSHFAANREDCNGQGKKESLLGYDLKQ